MPTKPTAEVRSSGSQRDNRWLATVYDQHKSSRFPRGRPFWGYLEYPAERQSDPGFVSELTPGDHNDPFNSSWSAPWMPDQVTVYGGRSTYRINVKRDGLLWLYATIIADDQTALQNYYEAAAKIAYQMGWDAPNFGQMPSFQILSILRMPPRSPKIAEAALAGDPWILGMTDQVNEELAALLRPVPRPFDAGTRVVQNITPTLKVQDVLAPNADIARMVAQAVEEALSAERAKKVNAAARARAGKKAKHDKTSSAPAMSG